jgi:hypothetical protein
MQGYTVSELAAYWNVSTNTARGRLVTAKIKPLSYECLYPLDTLDRLKDVKTGRPAKSKKHN